MGVAKIDGYPLFIENALPGERVEVLVVKAGNKFGYGKVEKWLTESPDRQPLKDNRLLRTGIAPLAHLNYGGNYFLNKASGKCHEQDRKDARG